MALICNPPATQITNGKIRRLQTRKIASSRNRKKQPNQKKIPKKKWHCRLRYGCLWVLQLAFLMTADLDAQPRLTKHFDSPFVVRLRLCFSPFFFIIVFLLFKSLRKIPGVYYLSPPIIIIRVTPTRRHGCQYMFIQGKVDSLRSIIAAFTLVLEYGCPGILVVLSIVECSAYEDICPSIPNGAIYSFRSLRLLLKYQC